jgi:hypothetical protein
MRHTLVIAAFLLSFGSYLFAQNQVPVVDLPPAPNSIVTDPDEDQYSNTDVVNTILDYYQTAVAYQTQLQLKGVRLDRRIVRPRVDLIINDPAQEVIEAMLTQQWEQVKYFYNELQRVPSSAINEKLNQMQKLIYDLEEKLLADDSVMMALSLKNSQNSKYEGLFKDALAGLETGRGEANHCTVPSIGLSAGAQVIVPDVADLTVGGSPYISLYINPTSMLGMPNILDFWLDYSNPRFTVHYTAAASDLTHNGTLMSVGLNARILPISYLLNIKNFAWDIKAGLGWFWMVDDVNNSTIASDVWNGCQIKLETSVNNFATKLPFGIFASYSFMHINNTLTAGTLSQAPLDSKWMSGLNLGLRFYLTSGKSACCSTNAKR